MSIKIKLIIALIAISFLSCNSQNKNTNNSKETTMKKYEWRPTANAPKYYPAQIISGNFYLVDSSVINIPKGHTLMSGWGKTGATHVVGEDFKAIPNTFDIKWVSYLEEKFYGGTFTLPQDKIESLFNQGYINILGEKTTYSNIVLGLAPGGTIVVWLYGDTTVEIARFKANQISVTKEEFIPNAALTVDQFVKKIKARRISEDIKGAIDTENIPFGLWDSYRTKYNWKPIFLQKNKAKFTKIYLDYTNGENLYTVASNPKLKEFSLKALPKNLKMYWEDQDENVYGSKILFNETEVKKAFNTLDNNASEEKKIELILEIDKYNGDIVVSLKSESNTIKLDKTEIKIFESTK